MPKLPGKHLFILGTVIWTFVVLGLTFLPGEYFPKISVRHIDKYVHFILFGIYGFLVGGSLLYKNRSVGKFITILLLITVFGVSIEGFQTMIPGRSFELYDIGINFLGALLGLTNFLVIYSKKTT